MKFKMISENDVKVLCEARKVLKKLKKRENKFIENAINNLNTCQQNKDYMRLIKELDVLHINVEDDNGDMSLEAQ